MIKIMKTISACQAFLETSPPQLDPTTCGLTLMSEPISLCTLSTTD